MSAVVSSQLPRIVSVSWRPFCEVKVALALLPITVPATSALATLKPSRVRGKEPTLKTTLHLHNLLSARTFDGKRRMDMHVLLYDTEQVDARHIRHLFAPGNGHDFAFDLEERSAICELD